MRQGRNRGLDSLRLKMWENTDYTSKIHHMVPGHSRVKRACRLVSFVAVDSNP